MKSKLKNLLPSPFELAGLAFLDLLVVFLGNTNELLNYYGLNSSNQALKGVAKSHVNSRLIL